MLSRLLSKKNIRRIINYFKKNILFFTVLVESNKHTDRSKIIYLDITHVRLDRYLANLVTFFKLYGYTVYFPRDKNLIYKLNSKTGESNFIYSILDAQIKFGKPRPSSNALIFNANQLSNNYFKNFEESSKNLNAYYVPMSEYPLIYTTYKLKADLQINDIRNCSVFMSGNFDKISYKKITEAGIFDIINRRDIYGFIIKKDYFKKLNHFAEINISPEDIINQKVYLVDTHNDFSIELDKLKGILAKFDFFMALPGVIIPQAHNLIEAMSVGCIPVIHKTYADLFIPKLKHMENAVLYSSLIELDIMIYNIFTLEPPKIIFMRNNILNYYENHLSPKTVVKNITQPNIQKLFIQAEHESIRLLKNNYEKR